jgi:anti-sigma regulatory factor (Ser/Thr protein kinase)
MTRVLELSFPADSRYLVLARLSLAGIAPVARLDENELADLKLAVTEACANAVRHAYPDDAGGIVRLSVSVEPKTLTVEVADDGRGLEATELAGWEASRMREEGMGFSIMRAVVDDVHIESAASQGTVVRLVKRLSHGS